MEDHHGLDDGSVGTIQMTQDMPEDEDEMPGLSIAVSDDTCTTATQLDPEELAEGRGQDAEEAAGLDQLAKLMRQPEQQPPKPFGVRVPRDTSGDAARNNRLFAALQGRAAPEEADEAKEEQKQQSSQQPSQQPSRTPRRSGRTKVSPQSSDTEESPLAASRDNYYVLANREGERHMPTDQDVAELRAKGSKAFGDIRNETRSSSASKLKSAMKHLSLFLNAWE